ncbi:hypothetical protein [Nitratireductor luteus]|uniref:hypothetical protein n=1 Tax=Nitratireductor luteus TaxID=2976980 RepID=UPI00223FB403|nr:hypothetical protein [Nitratireductor luteus]
MADKDHYSNFSIERRQESEEIIPIPAKEDGGNSDKNVNRTRVKSVYRDALFRPVFQAVAELEAAAANGRTSVTYHAPSHPRFSTLHLTTKHLPLSPSPSFLPERLSVEEEIRAARFWRQYAVELNHYPRAFQKAAPWRDLSDEASLEWFHYATRASGPFSTFTLRLDADTEAKVRNAASSAGWLSKRIARRLKEALGRTVPFWFGFEVNAEDNLHAHGELTIAEDELPAARKALRLAGGEWAEVRQHQAHTKQQPSAVWSFYAAKQAIFMRPLTGRFANRSRPINGDWVYASNEVRSAAGKIYSGQHKKILHVLSQLDQ